MEDTRAFSDPVCPFEDFKAEIIALYLEATAAREHSLADVTNRACMTIHPETELGECYSDFLVISRFLIINGCISMQMQEHQFLVSLEQRLCRRTTCPTFMMPRATPYMEALQTTAA